VKAFLRKVPLPPPPSLSRQGRASPHGDGTPPLRGAPSASKLQLALHPLGKWMCGYLQEGIQPPMEQGRYTKIILMIKRIRTSRLSIKNSLSPTPNPTHESPKVLSESCVVLWRGNFLIPRKARS